MSQTADLIALGRALATADKTALAAVPPLYRDLARAVALRTAVIDRELNGNQIVNLGAGQDIRPWQGRSTGAVFYEVDKTDVTTPKLEALGEPFAAVRPVVWRRDIRDNLTDAGFRPEEPTTWLAEAFFMYLDVHQVNTMIRRCTAVSAPGSRFVATYLTEIPPLEVRSALAVVGEPIQWVGDLAALLAAHGWRVISDEPIESFRLVVAEI